MSIDMTVPCDNGLINIRVGAMASLNLVYTSKE
jgi:hypothetical protein